jgi:hypothetical protein
VERQRPKKQNLLAFARCQSTFAHSFFFRLHCSMRLALTMCQSGCWSQCGPKQDANWGLNLDLPQLAEPLSKVPTVQERHRPKGRLVAAVPLAF